MTDRLISCDDHMDLSQLPADLWTTRLPASLLDRAPHVEERDGQMVWVCDGKVCTFTYYDGARHGFAVRTHPGYAEDAAKQSFDEARRFLATHLPVTGRE